MNMKILPFVILVAMLSSCSSAYRQTQTPDDVYYSPGKTQEYASVQNRNDRYGRYSDDDYQDYTSSSEDRYLRMKVQDRYRWNSLDNFDYWYSPTYAFNNYYGFRSFNPYSFNTWGLNFYYSPFASIQPYGWFNTFYPSYGLGYGYSPYSSAYYAHGSYGYPYYGYTPVSVVANSGRRTNTSRPLLGGYTNNAYSNANNRRNTSGDRYVPANNNRNNRNSLRFDNSNNSSRYNNNSINNNRSYTPPARSYTPSSSGSSSSSGGSVSRPPRHN